LVRQNVTLCLAGKCEFAIALSELRWQNRVGVAFLTALAILLTWRWHHLVLRFGNGRCFWSSPRAACVLAVILFANWRNRLSA
jgi:hypothetical protein